ncbi:hypothetical protein FAZ19_09665 [Sphingobacterium alkalisoli]|uniref:Uncharacterized protein n=1 Tax=Sphingobacterium alkalisoli TaxID=1874115 RepID=A0A4U0H1E8_9SPHI|nr:hypothetical protein [Sphingobacterium alkalisoli]TJY65407.1 hypothetical protein FAZ19_09665 [Sphingobacterium alkalisoli]
MVNFLFPRIQETISLSKFVKAVKLGFHTNENFGNEHIKLTYVIKGNDSYNGLDYNDQREMFRGASHYIFTLSTYSDTNYGNFREKLLRILEFKHIYQSIATYITFQLEGALMPNTAIKIQEIDLWPEGIYAEKYLSNPNYREDKRNVRDAYRADVRQWSHLRNLAQETKKQVAEQCDQMCITDLEINKLFDIDLHRLRGLLVQYKIPIKISRKKIIDKIEIHAQALVRAIKTELDSDDFYGQRYPLYKLVQYMYNTYLSGEKTDLIEDQKSNFLRDFKIQPGDILQLSDNRLVTVVSVNITERNEIEIEYSILKVNLELSVRTRKISCKNVTHVLKEKEFLEFKNYSSTARMSILTKWMAKRKQKFIWTPFTPNLLSAI